MNEIGGYFELGFSNTKESYYPKFYAINTSRNALLLLIKIKNYTKVFIPFYTCNVIIDILINNNISIDFYQIDENLEIIDTLKDTKNEAILYTNYFGIKDKYIKKISSNYNNLIIDNAQAFFSNPVSGVDTFYSPRKFFGLPDGGFLYTKEKINMNRYPKDLSYERFSHLLKRVELTAKDGYTDFQLNETKLNDLPIRRMSKLTELILSQIDYESNKKIRNENFIFLHQKLKNINRLKIEIETINSPLIYPLLIKDGLTLRNKLTENSIYTANYWPGVLSRLPKKCFEEELSTHLVALPIDQRYNIDDMEMIINLISENI